MSTELKITGVDWNNLSFRQECKRIFDILDVRKSTRLDYQYRINLFLDFIHNDGNQLNDNTFLDFKRYLRERNDFALSTKNKYLIAAKIFLKELARIRKIPSDITQNIKTFTQNKKHKRTGFNNDEINMIMKKVKSLPSNPKNDRIRALLSLLVLQGFRQIEIIRIDVEDIDFATNIINIQGKGSDDKEPINLNPDTTRAVKDYMISSRISDGALFVSTSNNSKNKRLKTRALRRIICKIISDLGIDKTVHGFRHFFTTKLITSYRGDLLEVSRYTRHRSLEMLQVYNDNIKERADLPRFYETFSGINF